MNKHEFNELKIEKPFAGQEIKVHFMCHDFWFRYVEGIGWVKTEKQKEVNNERK